MDKETALAQWTALREVELFLFKEAQLADEHRYKEWLALWTEELLYWVPCNSDEPAIGRKIALINDNRPELDERLYRLGTKHAHSQSPKSRLTRTIGNVVLEEWDAAKGGRVSSRFVLTEVRNGRQMIFAGRLTHVLQRHTDGELRMREKHVHLANNDIAMPNLTFVI
jgi:3-phenylpropionate/cinnamic acid dioxygenase small subunit